MLILTHLHSQNIIDRVKNSPYPFSNIPDTLFIIIDNNFVESQLLTIESLQGILAKEEPRIYRDRGNGYSIWLSDLINNYQIVADSSFINEFAGLLNHFKNKIYGYVLCNLHTNSSNAAISLCSIFNCIAITLEHVNLMSSLNIPQLYDVRNYDENWVLTNFDTSFSKKIVGYQKENKDLFLADYSIFARAFHFFDFITSYLTLTAVSRLDDNSVLFGWGNDEHQTVAFASSKSVYVHPADWVVNLSTLSNFNVPIQQHTHTDTVETIDSVHTVCFVMTDGDNVQWLLNDFATSNNWYGSSNRGNINLGWTISPALCELAPTVMNYLYQSAANNPTGKDYFITGPSGLGYIYPDQFPAIDSATSLLNRYMEKADLSIVNIIGDNPSEQYLLPFLLQNNIDAIFYYDYSNYSGLSGDIFWVNWKPVIGGRYNLWSGFETPLSLANKLNSRPKDPHSEDGYSLIPVHVWSMGVDDVIACVNLLNNNVRVTTPDQFVDLIQNNLGLRLKIGSQKNIPSGIALFQNFPNPFNSETTIRFMLPSSGNVELSLYNILGNKVKVVFRGKKNAGIHSLKLNGIDLSSGIYFYKLKSKSLTLTKKSILIK
jgi:hypothetical protein